MTYQNFSQATYDDLIFENRNKEYGAYVLRKEYAKNSFLAFFISLSFLVLLLIVSMWPKSAISSAPTVIHEAVHPILLPPLHKKQQLPHFKNSAPKPPKFSGNIVPVVTNRDVPENLKVKENEQSFQTSGDSLSFGTGLSGIDGALSGIPDGISNNSIVKKDTIYKFVDESPRFPGGETARIKYLQKNTVYPDFARRIQEEGTVYVSFVVKPDGSITSVKIKRGIDKELNQEALRVIRLMPKWSPGKKNGQAVYTQCITPITFKLR